MWCFQLPPLALLVVLGLQAAALGEMDEAATSANDRILRGVDLDGRLHEFAASADCRGVAVVFLATQCPISNGSLPELARLAANYKHRGVEFYGVISDPAVSRADAVRHRDEYRISFPVLFDASANLRRKLKPTHTPQALVLAPSGELLYSGRIDDRYPSVGRKRDAASSHELDDALKAVVSGRKIAVPRTQPVGCVLEEPPAAAVHGSVTFNRDIAPLMLTACAECHRPGEAGPFSLLTYDDACRHAKQIADVTERRVMPPWHPADGFGRFRDERRLKDDELALFRQWVADGKPEGDPQDRPAQPKVVTRWRLGKPDLVLKMKEPFVLSADGPDVHQHFVLPSGLKTNRLVAGVEFRPGNPRIVHHASFYIDTSGAARKLDERDQLPGYGSFSGPGFENYGSLRSWLPGMTPRRLPRGMGAPLPAHSDLVLEIHYQRSGKVESDQSSVGLFFAESSARQLVMELQVMNKDLSIPAGEPRHYHRAAYTVPVDVTLYDAAPHMHLLGREMKATARQPDGVVKPLVWIKDWDFNWQGQYAFVDAIRLPKGTRIDVEAWYDNSAGNALNPHSPPQTVSWGEQTREEMGLCHFHFTCDNPDDLATIRSDYRAYVSQQQEAYRHRRQGEGAPLR